MTLANYTENC